MPRKEQQGLVQTAFAQITTDVSTTSRSFVDLLTLSMTNVRNNGTLIARLDVGCGSGALNGTDVHFRITVDGAATRATCCSPGYRLVIIIPYSFWGSCRLLVKVTGLSAGSHTIKAQWFCDASTATINGVSNPDRDHAALLVKEVFP